MFFIPLLPLFISVLRLLPWSFFHSYSSSLICRFFGASLIHAVLFAIFCFFILFITSFILSVLLFIPSALLFLSCFFNSFNVIFLFLSRCFFHNIVSSLIFLYFFTSLVFYYFDDFQWSSSKSNSQNVSTEQTVKVDHLECQLFFKWRIESRTRHLSEMGENDLPIG